MTDKGTQASWSCRVLRAGRLLLDGGSMFGVIPRVVWTRLVTPDDKNRIEVHHNALLLEGPPESPGGRNRLVVVETGSGNKLPSKMKDIFGLDGRWIGDALHEVGCDAADISDVIVTHLHFDHAGGLTRLPLIGEKPAWSGDDLGGGGGAGVALTFPGARIHVQAREWSDAVANRSVMTKTYYPDHILPVAERLVLHDSPRPFVSGETPDRDDLPRSTLEQRETPVMPGISVFLAPGHTWGQQAVKVNLSGGGQMVYTPDVMPTAAHVGAAASLAYDVEPYTSMMSKRWFLGEAAARGWTLCLDHEPGEPVFTVESDGKGWYRLARSGG